jgi:3-phosphoshikimate 1-carboxyvinyltransferase
VVAAPRVGVGHRRPLAGRFTPPGDKSITHRALLFGLLAHGSTRVSGANPGEDCARSAAAASALGAEVVRAADGWVLHGTGGVLRAPAAALDCGNSGTTLRLLAGIVAAHPLAVTLSGDASLSRRPMRRIVEPLTRMGAELSGQGDDCTPPLTVRGGGLRGIDYAVPMPSAQVATCVLLAGLTASGVTRVSLPGPARDHTERMLPAFGVVLEREEHADGGRSVSVRGGQSLRATDVRVPGDFSAAAFLFAAAAAETGASVTALGVNVNPTRTGFLDVLRAMGARVAIERERVEAGEPTADVSVTGPDELTAFDVPAAWLPRMVDEAPAWAVVAAAARGTSRLAGASELRVKESDRIASIAAGLRAVGIAVEESADALAVTGGRPRGGAHIATHHDHRIAMAFAVLGCRAREPLWFDDLASVATSYPAFFQTLAALGGGVTPEPATGGGA